ncbi:MAG TPA: hypothetical protein VGM90_30845 [Kofleriaceae bacterium]
MRAWVIAGVLLVGCGGGGTGSGGGDDGGGVGDSCPGFATLESGAVRAAGYGTAP